MKKRPLVLVEWEDISGTSTWSSEEEIQKDAKPIFCQTVGWRLPSKNKRVINIVATRTEQGDASDRTTLPRGCVRSIRRLE